MRRQTGAPKRFQFHRTLWPTDKRTWSNCSDRSAPKVQHLIRPHQTRILVLLPCNSRRIPNSGSCSDQRKSCCGQLGAIDCQHLSPSSTLGSIDTYRNILCLNGSIKLGVGNIMHRGLMTEQDIRMDSQLSRKLQIALERRCDNSCGCTRQRSQGSKPLDHSWKIHIDSALGVSQTPA